jgi:coenzyme F420-reducing hydrogenase delta subunit/NAD-dependent dihydropyrimidine dehydrogenase PreA subunit
LDQAANQRIGVFICRCGGDIENNIDTDSIARTVRSEAGVVHASIHDFLCSKSSREAIVKTITDEGLDRVVISACSPRLYLQDFQEAVVDGGLDRCMLEMANIREQCSWIHWENRELQTAKAEDMTLMAVAKLRNQFPSEKGNIAIVNKVRCTGCGVCEAVCNVNAIKVVEDPEAGGKRKANVNPKACEGCGACVSACPTAAMDQTCFSNAQVVAEIETALRNSREESTFPSIVVFSCHHCSYAAADTAGLKRLGNDAHFRAIRVMCSARVDPEWVLKALSSGADGVMILAGSPGRCHYEVGNLRTRKRMTLLKIVLQQLGFDEDRFLVEFVDEEQPEKYRTTIEEYIQKIRDLGPNPIIPATRPEQKRLEIPGLKL